MNEFILINYSSKPSDIIFKWLGCPKWFWQIFLSQKSRSGGTILISSIVKSNTTENKFQMQRLSKSLLYLKLPRFITSIFHIQYNANLRLSLLHVNVFRNKITIIQMLDSNAFLVLHFAYWNILRSYSSVPNKRTYTLISTKLPPCTLLFGTASLSYLFLWIFV